MVTNDRSAGFFRRFDLIEFKRVFSEEEQDPDLIDKLRMELPGIMNWALVGLRRLVNNSWLMSKSKEFEKAHAEFKQQQNPVAQFIEERGKKLDHDGSGPDSIECRVFRQKFEAYCVENGYKILNEVNLGKEVKRLGYPKNRIRLGDGSNNRIYVYEGLTIKPIWL